MLRKALSSRQASTTLSSIRPPKSWKVKSNAFHCLMLTEITVNYTSVVLKYKTNHKTRQQKGVILRLIMNIGAARFAKKVTMKMTNHKLTDRPRHKRSSSTMNLNKGCQRLITSPSYKNNQKLP